MSVCPICGAARAGAATPMREAVAHDVDDSWLRFRRACHARIRDYLTRVHEGMAPEKAYWATYDAVGRRGKVHSEEEDPATFRGGFYRAVVKMFDITVQDRRVQGYNGLADWEEMRDFVFRKYAPADVDKALADKVLLLHGGNGAWPRQQIASDLLRSDDIKAVAMDLAFGADGTPPDRASDAEIVARLERLYARDKKALPLGTKVFHVFAPARWPALTPRLAEMGRRGFVLGAEAPAVTPRATPEVGEELGIPIPEVAQPRDYLAFAQAIRDIAAAKKHEDLDRTDVLLADTWSSLHGDDEDADAAASGDAQDEG